MRSRPGFRPFLLLIAVSVAASLQGVDQTHAERSTGAAAKPLPFQDPHQPMRTRIDDLLGRLTLAEKISLLHQFQPAIPRLGMPPFKTGTEGLHGVAWTTDRDNNGAVVTAAGTVFPQAIGMASTWRSEERRVGKECRSRWSPYH